MHPSTRSLCSLAQGDSLHLNLRKVKTYHYPPFHIVTRVHFDLFFPRNPGRDDLFIDLLSELLLVVVRFENKVIVSESQRDESNYAPFDALALLACSG